MPPGQGYDPYMGPPIFTDPGPGGGMGSVPPGVDIWGQNNPAPAPADPMGPAVPTWQQQVDQAAAQSVADAEMQRRVAEADAALAQRAANPTSGDVIDQLMADNISAQEMLEMERAGLAPRRVSTPNPFAPIAQRQYREYKGGGALDYPDFEPEPMEPLPRFEGESDADYAERSRIFEDADLRTQMESYQRNREQALMEAQQLGNVRDIGAPGHLGFEEAQRQAGEQVDAAAIEGAQAVADAKAGLAEKQADATRAMMEREAEMERRLDEQERAVSQLQDIRNEARRKLAEEPKFDRQRFTKNLKTGKKVALMLEAFAAGFQGRPALWERLEAADLQEQEMNYEKARGEYKDVIDQADSGLELYRFFRENTNDKRTAGMMYRQAQIEDEIAAIDAKIAETTVPEIQAVLQQQRVEREQALRQVSDQLELQARTTPQNIVRTVDSPEARRRRKAIDAEQDALRKERYDLRGKLVESTEKALERRSKAEAAKASTEVELRKQDRQIVAQHAKDTAKLRGVTEGFKTFVRKYRGGDIKGRGLDAYFLTEEGRAVREDLLEETRKQLYAESGANAPPAEIESRAESIVSGYGDNELLSNVQRIIRSNERQLVAAEQGLSEEARQMLYRDPSVAPLPAIAPVGRSQGVDLDAEALGGRVVNR